MPHLVIQDKMILQDLASTMCEEPGASFAVPIICRVLSAVVHALVIHAQRTNELEPPRRPKRTRQNRTIDFDHPPAMLTVAEAERLSGWSHNRMQAEINAGTIESEKRGRRRWIFRDSLSERIKALRRG